LVCDRLRCVAFVQLQSDVAGFFAFLETLQLGNLFIAS
jgi:hypothetical protein